MSDTALLKRPGKTMESHFTIAIHIIFPVLVCPHYHHEPSFTLITHHYTIINSHYHPMIVPFLIWGFP